MTDITHNECSMEATTTIQRLEQKAIWNERIAKTYEKSCPPTSKAYARDAADLREAISALNSVNIHEPASEDW